MSRGNSDKEQRLYLNSVIPKRYETIETHFLYQICSKRVRAYKKIEEQSIGMEQNPYAQFLEKVHKILVEENLIQNFMTGEGRDNHEEDLISFHFLQLAYSKNEDTIQKFVRYEAYILETRITLQASYTNDIAQYLDYLNIYYQTLDTKTFEKIKLELSYSSNDLNPKRQEFICLSFQDATISLERMKAYLLGGMAYIKNDQILSIVINKYKLNLTDKLTQISETREYQNIFSSDKIKELVSKLEDVDSVKDDDFFSLKNRLNQGYGLKLQNVNLFSKQSFPLCMKYLFDKLQELHHLKHFGRLQLQLFMKKGGLSKDEAVYWWKFQFTQTMTPAQFTSQYLYGIQYNYGEQGQKKDFSCPSCKSIMLSSAPSKDEYHGCPFKTFSTENIQRYLQLQGIDRSDMEEILEMKKGNHYTIACRKTFYKLHPDSTRTPQDLIIDHPLKYYEASRQYYDPNPQKHNNQNKQQQETN